MKDSKGRGQRVKKEHYVPRFYLRRFAYDGTHLFACDTFDGRSYGTRVQDVASEHYFNDAPLDSETSSPGDRDPLQTLEHHLSELEGLAATALGTLIKGIEHTKVIDRSVREEVARFIAVQVLRTLETRVTAAQMWDRVMMALRHERLEPSLESWLVEATRPDGAAIVQSQMLRDGSTIQKIAEALLGHFWFVGLNSTGMPLWTSDHPVVRTAHFHDPLRGTSGLASRGIEIDIPLTPTMVLVLAERTYHANLASRDGKTFVLVPDNIVYLNSQQAIHCYRYVYSSADTFGLVRQIRDEWPERFRPDRNRVQVVSPVPRAKAARQPVQTRLWSVVRKLMSWRFRQSGFQ